MYAMQVLFEGNSTSRRDAGAGQQLPTQKAVHAAGLLSHTQTALQAVHAKQMLPMPDSTDSHACQADVA